MLSVKEAKVVIVILEGITNILLAAEKFNQEESICMMIEECGGLDKIEQLQSHENEQVYNSALRLIEKFFTAEDDSAVLAPVTTDQGNYDFNAGNQVENFEFWLYT